MTAKRRLSPLKLLLAERIQKHRREIWDWHASYAKKAPPPVYCSIDLRDSGHKIVPVDSNLYPAGFNNICPDDLMAAPPILRAELEVAAGFSPKKILILPELNTTNTYYIENLHYLRDIVRDAHFEVQLGWYDERAAGETFPADYDETIHLTSFTGKKLEAHRVRINDGRMSIPGFEPDVILLNNDFSSGYPKMLDSVKQPIFPSHRLGWHTRKKSEHFIHYNRLAAEFAQIIGIDPWAIQIDTTEVAPVNFNEEMGLDRVADEVDAMIARLKGHYEKAGIKEEPFVFVKNNAGTYGMGIMTCHSGDEVRKANRRTKNKMSVGKGHSVIGSVAVQEGVPTATLIDRLPAEPVIYLSGMILIGGFLRTNKERGQKENLNSQGMVFKKLCMSDLHQPSVGDQHETDTSETDGDVPILELVYGEIARISAIATGLEIAQQR